MMPLMRLPLPAFLLAFAGLAGAVSAALAAERVSGDAYSMAGNELLYHETQYLADGGAERVVLYSCPDGRAFARKQVRASGDALAPDFDLVDARLGYREGVRASGAAREVYVQRGPARPLQSDQVSVPSDGVIDTGFDAFARRHWSELVRGDTLDFTYLVPSRRSFYAFKVGRVDNPRDPRSMRLRLSMGSWLSFLLPHIDTVYDLATHQVVHYEGLSNIRGSDGKNYKVRADYPRIAAKADVAPAEVAAALATPLVSSCAVADARMSASGHAAVPEVTAAAMPRNRIP
jgi:hypothetical protein